MTKFWNSISRVAVTSAAVLAFGAGAQAADTIKIGAPLSVTGPASFLGDPEIKDAEDVCGGHQQGGRRQRQRA